MTLGRIKANMMRAGGVLLLAALLFRALIPAGFMTTVDTSGSIEIVMCSASGEHKTVTYKLPGDSSQPKSADETCAFAFTAVAPPQAQPELDAARIVYAYEYAFVAAQPDTPRAVFAPQAPPTGPPIQA